MNHTTFCADCLNPKQPQSYTLSHITCNDWMRSCIETSIAELEEELDTVDDSSPRAWKLVCELGELDRELEQL